MAIDNDNDYSDYNASKAVQLPKAIINIPATKIQVKAFSDSGLQPTDVARLNNSALEDKNARHFPQVNRLFIRI